MPQISYSEKISSQKRLRSVGTDCPGKWLLQWRMQEATSSGVTVPGSVQKTRRRGT